MARTVEDLWFDPYGPAEYPPDLYQYHAIAEGIDGFDAFSSEHIEFYREYGYLVINNAFNEQEVQAALDGLLDLIAGKNPEFRGVQFEATAREIVLSLPPEKRQDVVRKLAGYVKYEPRLQAIAEHPRLLEVVSQLLGEKPALWQDQALLKPPMIGREKPWHQDHAFFDLPLGTPIVGVWIALDEATPENGCMHIIPGSHRGGPVIHFKRRDWQICDTQVDRTRILAVPLKPGGALFFDGLLHHGTPASRSPKRRRSLQLHYIPASARRIPAEERLAIFGPEGKNVEC